MTVAITLTTINKPIILEALIKDFNDTGCKEEIHVIVMGDRKSPSENKSYCAGLECPPLFSISYFEIEQQETHFAKEYPRLYKHIPENSFARRNFADILALEENHEFIIRIDDDNFPIDGHPFINGHVAAMRAEKLACISSEDGWFNICDTLSERNGSQFFARGYPYEMRWKKAKFSCEQSLVKVGVNGGLWVGDPDIDAITRLHRPIEAISFDSNKFGQNFVLDKATNSPVNTQNTCYTREVMKAGFVSPFAGRYDDIISGYVINSLRHGCKFDLSFGAPILFQDRNAHNLWNDLKLELNGNEHIWQLLKLMDQIELETPEILQGYGQLIAQLTPELGFAGEFLSKIFEGMNCWFEDVSNSNRIS